MKKFAREVELVKTLSNKVAVAALKASGKLLQKAATKAAVVAATETARQKAKDEAVKKHEEERQLILEKTRKRLIEQEERQEKRQLIKRRKHDDKEMNKLARYGGSVQCDACSKWRKVQLRVLKPFKPKNIIFQCKLIDLTCVQQCHLCLIEQAKCGFCSATEDDDGEQQET